MAKVACTVMLKDEVALTAPFLSYHAALFGTENLYVIDNGSKEPTVLETLATFEKQGVNVDRSFCTPEDYRRKGEIIGNLVKRLDETTDYDLYILLDCDEFVIIKDRSDGSYTCNPQAIHRYLDTLRGQNQIFQVKQNLSNIPGRPETFLVDNYAKTIFPRNTLGATDHGHHGGWTRTGDKNFVPCDVVYVHFHFRPYEDVLKFSRQKLSTEIPPEDLDNPEKLQLYRGRGWHLIKNLLGGPANYYSQFKGLNNTVVFNDLIDRFSEIGSKAPFSDFILPPEAYGSSNQPIQTIPHIVIDEATTTIVRGWAIDFSAPDRPLFLQFFIDETLIWKGVCDQLRPDVLKGGQPSEKVGFVIDIPSKILGKARHYLTIKDSKDTPMRMSIDRHNCYEVTLLQAAEKPLVDISDTLYGRIDGVRNGVVHGWVLRSVSTPEGQRLLGRCTVAIIHDGRIVMKSIADAPRPDVAEAMNGEDRCGFHLKVPDDFPRDRSHMLRLFVIPERQELSGSPCVIAPTSRTG